MSLEVTAYRCSRCDFEQGDLRAWGTREYVLANGVRIPVDWNLGWCADCGGLVAVEEVSEKNRREALREAEQASPARRGWRILNMLAALLDPSRAERARWHACRAEDAKDAIAMLQGRQNPPRCLGCGGARVIAPLVTRREALSGTSTWEDERRPKRTGFVHPDCGGELWMSASGMRIGLMQAVRRYTPEGDFIESEAIPGYSSPAPRFYDERDEANARIRGMRPPPVAREWNLPRWLRRRAD